jgi:hypothetical protein
MANKGEFRKGHKVEGSGRPIGTPNKVTATAKEMVVQLVESGLPTAMAKLQQIENPKDYLDALAKFISYVVPKQVDATVTTVEKPVIIDWSTPPKLD